MQDKSSSQQPLEQILLEAGLISIGQIKLALQTQQECELEISKILVLYNWIKQETVDFFHSQWFELLEEAEKKPLVYYVQKAGLMDAEEIDTVFRLQKFRLEEIKFHRLVIEEGYLKRITVDFLITHLFGTNNPHNSIAKSHNVLESYANGQKNFQNIELLKAPLMGVNLERISLNDANLRKADLNKANLSYSSFVRANLTMANFHQATLTEVDFTSSFLTMADFHEAHLERANFQYAILLDANFRSAYLAQADFSGADLTGANLPLFYDYDIYYDRQTIFDYNFSPKIMNWKSKDTDV